MDIEVRKDIYEEIRSLLSTARENIVSNVSSTMTKTYFMIEKRICRRRTIWRKKSRIWKKLDKNII